jgi:hypothetical protein
MRFEINITRRLYRSGLPKLVAREISKRSFTVSKSTGDQRGEEYIYILHPVVYFYIGIVVLSLQHK